MEETDLTDLIKKMKISQKWKDGDIDSLVLFNSSNRQTLLTAMHEGTEINSFQNSDSATFQIVEGKIEFRTRKESTFLNTGQVLTLHEKIKYRLTSSEETVLLLTLLNSTMEHA